MRSTSYLVPSKPTHGDPSPTQHAQILGRLLETMQFVIDVMGGSIPPSDSPKSQWSGPGTLTPLTGEGWKSAIRVRLLHALARRRILSKPNFDATQDGIPINQEDLAHTLAAFSFVPLHSLPELGLGFTKGQADATIAFWRHVGFVLGLDSHILRRHFADWESAEMFGATCGQVLLLELGESSTPDPEPATIPMLAALDGMLESPLSDRLGICRYLIGDNLSSILRLPATPLRTAVRIRWVFALAAIPVWFGRVYTRRWEEERGRLTVEGLGRMVRWKMGMRRTAFRPRSEKGELVEGVREREGVVRVEEDVQRFIGAWRGLMREMVLVLVAAGVAIVGGLVVTWWIW